MPYRRGAKVQPITTHRVHADDAGGTSVAGSGLAQPFTHYLGQFGRVDGYNIRVNLAIGP